MSLTARLAVCVARAKVCVDLLAGESGGGRGSTTVPTTMSMRGCTLPAPEQRLPAARRRGPGPAGRVRLGRVYKRSRAPGGRRPPPGLARPMAVLTDV